MAYAGLTGFLGNAEITPEERARQLLTHLRAIPYEDAVSALTEQLCGFQEGVKNILRPVVEEFRMERDDNPELDTQGDDDRIIMTLPLGALRVIRDVYDDVPGAAFKCQAGSGVKGEASSATPLQAGLSGEAKQILRMERELKNLRLQIADLTVDNDERLMLARLKADATIEEMDRASLLQVIANLEAKYRFADIDGCITSSLRDAAKQVFAGNCAFADDDLNLLRFCAKWALENGIPDDLCPNIFPKAKATLSGEHHTAKDHSASEQAGVTKILRNAENSQSQFEERAKRDDEVDSERGDSLTQIKDTSDA